MFENSKWYLYYLVEAMLKGRIDGDFFCTEIYVKFTKEHDVEFSPKESDILHRIENITKRFSDSEEDHLNFPGVFFTLSDLLNIVEVAADELGIKSRNP